MTIVHGPTHRHKDRPLPPDTGICLCRGCGRRFQSLRAFDIHRVGPLLDRACLPTPRMAEKRLEQDSRGVWRLPKREFSTERRRELEVAA
jgi:hypothetical protein